MTNEKLIKDSVEDVKNLFSKLDVDLSTLDITGRSEAMFNSAFIKVFLNRLNYDDYELFKKLRDDYFRPSLTLSFPEVPHD